MSRLAAQEDGSFLGRLASAGKAEGLGLDAPDPQVPPIRRDALVKLIVRNLNHLLRSRKGYDCVMLDYGLGDYDDPRHIDRTIQKLVSEIGQAIAAYEPRLASPVVLAVSHDKQAAIQLSIEGLVLGEPCKLQARFETRARHITVKEAAPQAAPGTPAEIAQSLLRKVTVREV